MDTYGTVVLRVASTGEKSWGFPANTSGLRLRNISPYPIRISFLTGKVADPSITENPTYLEFDVLAPFEERSLPIDNTLASAGTLYYASEGFGASFEVEAIK